MNGFTFMERAHAQQGGRKGCHKKKAIKFDALRHSLFHVYSFFLFGLILEIMVHSLEAQCALKMNIKDEGKSIRRVCLIYAGISSTR